MDTILLIALAAGAIIMTAFAQARPIPPDDGEGVSMGGASHRETDFLVTDDRGNAQLHWAAERGDVPACAALVAKGLPVDARNNSGLTPLHMAACNGQLETARWLLDHGADLHAITASDYEYLWSGASPGYGMEKTIPARSTPMSIAFRYHQETKWVLGQPRQLVELLEERGAKRPLTLLRIVARIVLALPLMALTAVLIFWGLLHVDGSMTGWKTLAERFPAVHAPAASMNMHQDGDVGTVGLMRLKRMLRAAANDDGLYLAFPGLLRAGHKPLLIPWNALHIRDEQTLLGVYILTLEARQADNVAGADAIRITLRDGISAEVKARLNEER